MKRTSDQWYFFWDRKRKARQGALGAEDIDFASRLADGFRFKFDNPECQNCEGDCEECELE